MAFVIMEYYRLPLYVLFGILPSSIWLIYYSMKDIHPEPKKMVLKVFMLGAFSTIPVFFIQIAIATALTQLQGLAFFASNPLAIEFLKWFLVIALTEEVFKYLAVRFSVMKSRELDEPLDIMLYMVVSALGFAALENILYLFSPISGLSFNEVLKSTIAISFIRFIGATFLHTLCSALLGYFLAMSFLHSRRSVQWIIVTIGIATATALHGFYDFSIMVLYSPFNFIIPATLVLGLAIFIIMEFDRIKKLKSICK